MCCVPTRIREKQLLVGFADIWLLEQRSTVGHVHTRVLEQPSPVGETNIYCLSFLLDDSVPATLVLPFQICSRGPSACHAPSTMPAWVISSLYAELCPFYIPLKSLKCLVEVSFGNGGLLRLNQVKMRSYWGQGAILIRSPNRGAWEDGSGGKNAAVQAQGPKFESPAPGKSQRGRAHLQCQS